MFDDLTPEARLYRAGLQDAIDDRFSLMYVLPDDNLTLAYARGYAVGLELLDDKASGLITGAEIHFH